MNNETRAISEEIYWFEEPQQPQRDTDLARHHDRNRTLSVEHSSTQSSATGTRNLSPDLSGNRKRASDSRSDKGPPFKRRNIRLSTSRQSSSTASAAGSLLPHFHWENDDQSSTELPILSESNDHDAALTISSFKWLDDGIAEEERLADEVEIAYFGIRKPRKPREPEKPLPRPWETIDAETAIYLDIADDEEVDILVGDAWSNDNP